MILVIGYGNDLRSDDGVGRRVAEAVAGWDAPGIRAVSAHQLTPELAEPVADADEVIFVDACVDSGDGFHWKRVEARPTPVGHFGDPGSLLALAESVYGKRPHGWLMAIPVENMDFGETLTPFAAQGLDSAIARIQAFAAQKSRRFTRTGEDDARSLLDAIHA